MKLLSLIALLAFILMIQTVEALSMGTVVKKDTASIKIGESAKFEILFWNIEDVSYNVELEVKEAPKDWLVVIQPKEFALNSSTGEEYIILPYTDKSVKAFPVNVFVKPENTEIGRHNVIIIARAGLSKEGISFFQERKFKLIVDVIGLQAQLEAGNEVSNITTELQPSTGKSVSQISFDYPFYIIIYICILVVSLIIYKYG